MRMPLSKIFAAIATLTLLQSTPAMALFDLQLLIGQRSGTLKDTDSGDSDKIKGSEVQLAGHVDPIPLVPVAFGLYLANYNMNDIDNANLKSATGLEGGFQVYAWLPLGIIGVKPYAKLSLPLYSAIKVDGTVAGELDGVATDFSTSIQAETSGMHLHFGLGWSPIPLVTLLAEANISDQKLKSKEVKVAGQKVDGMDFKRDYKSTAFLVGVEIGL